MLLSLAASSAATDPTAAVAELAAPPRTSPLQRSRSRDRCASAIAPGCARCTRTSKKPRRIGARVFVTSGGRYYVPPPSDRGRILAARNDDEFAARIARAAPSAMPRACAQRCIESPTAGDLYIAHVFGAEAAISLLEAAVETPDAPLAKHFPELAAAPLRSPEIKAPITVGQFYRRFPARCMSRRVSSPSACGRRWPTRHAEILPPRRTAMQQPLPGRRKSASPRRSAALSSGTARPARAHRGCGRDRTS